jgi:hypothetical protein
VNLLNNTVDNSVTIRRSQKEWDAFCKMVQNATSVNPIETKSDQEKRKKNALKCINNFLQTYFPFYADNGDGTLADCAYFHEDAAKAILADANIFAALEWPREHAKTVYAGVIYPLFLMVQNQMKFYLHLGRNADLAEDHISEIKYVLENASLFIHDWSEDGFKSLGSWEKDDFTTKTGVRFKGLGRGQAPQGTRDKNARPDYIHFCDLDDYEIINNEKQVLKVVDWMFGAVIPAGSIKRCRVVCDGNRIHPRSIMAHVVGDIDSETPKREDIYHSKVFATQKPNKNYTCAFVEEGGVPSWPRYTKEELSRRFKKVGVVKTKGEYYHTHILEGKIFTNIQFKPMRPLEEYKVIIGYFDPSFTNSPTSDFKAIAVWGLHGRERHCLKRYTKRSPVNDCYAWMWNYQQNMPSGVGIIWYIENQFFNDSFRNGLKAFNQANKADLRIICDTRDKENKYTRIVNMEPIYSLGEVYFNIDEYHSSDMIEGNNQLKGIEPGYKTPDDAPDADEGAWHYLQMHLADNNFKPRMGRTAHNKAY